MRLGRQNYKVDYGHLAFLTLITGYIVWYFFNTLSVSTSVNNILLVAPLSVFAVLMALIIVPQCVHRADAVKAEEKPEQYDPLAPKLPTERREVSRMMMLGGALGVFVFSLAYVGFDVAIFLFSAAAMAICGERRPLHLLAFSVVVTVIAVYGFRALMSYPMFTLLL